MMGASADTLVVVVAVEGDVLPAMEANELGTFDAGSAAGMASDAFSA